MLRESYAYGSDDLKAVLEEFKLGDTKLIDVTSFKMLSPDSFIWRLRMTDGIYYLYAEDFITDIESVKRNIQEIAGTHPGVFVKVKIPRPFNLLAPVGAATTYAKPEDYEKEIQDIVTESGYDLVFLYKIVNSKVK
jgi:hypothetical protein